MELGLAIVSGSRAGSVLPLANNAVVGSDSFADIVLSDPEVSTRHTQLFESGTGFQLLDLRSTGGTFVNGLRVPPEKAVSIPSGSVLRLVCRSGAGIAVGKRLDCPASQAPL